MTKSFRLSASLICLSGLLVFGLLVQSSLATSGVEIRGGSSHNLGVVSRTELIHHSITLHNPNRFPVVIHIPPSSGCHCVAADPTNASIPARGTLPVRFDIEPEGSGENTKAIRIVTQTRLRARETWLYITYLRPAKADS